jgi:hypothetical protein
LDAGAAAVFPTGTPVDKIIGEVTAIADMTVPASDG